MIHKTEVIKILKYTNFSPKNIKFLKESNIKTEMENGNYHSTYLKKKGVNFPLEILVFYFVFCAIS